MNKKEQPDRDPALQALCAAVRNDAGEERDRGISAMLRTAMERYPDAPEPHNLLGIVLEREGDHDNAMKHFRAAWALDPTYRPARQNLAYFGSYCRQGRCAIDESDCPPEDAPLYEVEYDAAGVGHMVRRRGI